MKLNAMQRAVLMLASEKLEINYYIAVRSTGANGRTLSALVNRALLTKLEYPDGSNAWRITDTGRGALKEPA